MLKAHAAGVFNDLVSNKKTTAQILCGGLFTLQQQKTLPARSRQRKNTNNIITKIRFTCKSYFFMVS